MAVLRTNPSAGHRACSHLASGRDLPGASRSGFWGGYCPGVSSYAKQPNRSEALRQRGPVRAVAFAEPPAALQIDGDDYYTILGVAYDASPKQIKVRYYEVMREIHPDLSNDAEQELAHELATFLNHVYETLSDADERAAYDSMVGLCADAMNPFKDKAQEADHVFVDELSCIGCRNCTNVCPKTFQMEEDFGRARVFQQKVDSDELLQEAIDTCPVNCIHWVSESQLSLLETTMGSMERIDVWQLMTGGGRAVNVFVEASLAWARRQSMIRARQQTGAAQKQSAGPGGLWNSFVSPAAGSTMFGGAKGGNGAADRVDGNGKAARRTKAAAAGAAAAARRWRDYQRTKRQRDQNLLPATSSQDN